MVLDTSAIVAILANEPEAGALTEAIEGDGVRFMSAASLLETAIVIEARYGMAGSEKLDELVTTAQIRIEPVTLEQVTAARLAYRMYGKGRHPARLNFGDCFAYALAKTTGERLLFKGDDFGRTDIQLVVLGE